MLRFFARRVLLTLPIFLALIALTFFALRLIPGDPIEVQARRARHLAGAPRPAAP